MTTGPPSSAAGPSRPPQPQQPAHNAQVSGPGIPPMPQPSLNNQPYYLSAPRVSVEPQRNPQYVPQPQWTNGWNAGYSQTPQPVAAYQRNPVVQSQYPLPPVPQNSYNGAQSFPQRTRFTDPYPHSRPTQKLPAPPIVSSQAPVVHLPPPLPRPPTPPPPKYRHWDRITKDFLTKLGFKQALTGFEADLLVMNPDFERASVPSALVELLQGIILIQQGVGESTPLPDQNRPLEDRKLDYVHTKNPTSHTSITKSISAFLAQNRAKNDASNRAEFLLSLAEKKRKRIDDDASRENPDGDVASDVSSCARTDAKTVDRDLQMKYDIAKNSDGPLRRTTRHKAKAPSGAGAADIPAGATSPSISTRTKSKGKSAAAAKDKEEKATSPVVVKTEPDQKEVHSGLDQRLGNIETHFSVKYVPAPPDSLLSRLQFLEEHIIRLEKDYPPWAALHFNQPNRGWPPPPRATPIIVPPTPPLVCFVDHRGIGTTESTARRCKDKEYGLELAEGGYGPGGHEGGSE
ncbi:hypothetical protein MSAN_00058600 [Mycena sanguinolenta]|uniref:Uncharacterized protein n=1 Tax=Mycena sanguinolenta TaxID=230812 RepID=A0A8H6ZJ08_9AGAR|nr:hypothetical protein MSAN_00058600 [Mycena sanguinolenta]